VVIGPEAAGNGVMLERLNLEALGVKVTAVRRKGVREANPSADTRLQTGDAIVLLGPQEALARAEIRLLQG
jgi:CPA2 family monovalent cation:H+ antiporter-2